MCCAADGRCTLMLFVGCLITPWFVGAFACAIVPVFVAMPGLLCLCTACAVLSQTAQHTFDYLLLGEERVRPASPRNQHRHPPVTQTEKKCKKKCGAGDTVSKHHEPTQPKPRPPAPDMAKPTKTTHRSRTTTGAKPHVGSCMNLVTRNPGTRHLHPGTIARYPGTRCARNGKHTSQVPQCEYEGVNGSNHNAELLP